MNCNMVVLVYTHGWHIVYLNKSGWIDGDVEQVTIIMEYNHKD
jgi:hypothetical protein